MRAAGLLRTICPPQIYTYVFVMGHQQAKEKSSSKKSDSESVEMVSGSTGYSKAAPWSTVPAQSTLYLIYNDDWHLGERRNHVREPCVF